MFTMLKCSSYIFIILRGQDFLVQYKDLMLHRPKNLRIMCHQVDNIDGLVFMSPHQACGNMFLRDQNRFIAWKTYPLSYIQNEPWNHWAVLGRFITTHKHADIQTLYYFKIFIDKLTLLSCSCLSLVSSKSS